jgi:hypothetical protein
MSTVASRSRPYTDVNVKNGDTLSKATSSRSSAKATS